MVVVATNATISDAHESVGCSLFHFFESLSNCFKSYTFRSNRKIPSKITALVTRVGFLFPDNNYYLCFITIFPGFEVLFITKDA